ncbi:siderophore-interacting protein [Prescottella subtropica]|uniref:siderophore-interacting protein n=1 Tax=Prescottella subtropica TaxID=2545757 RepID=UPI001F4F8742|nr:siderophore-interacting protein [Prescottella subtropica]
MPVDHYLFAPVTRVARITPNMQRITLSGGDLDHFRSSGDPDERLLVMFPTDGPEPGLRSYTVRHWNPATTEMDIDFAVHDGGAAVHWALHATPGDILGVTSASGWYHPPADTAWQLLIADMTALPAVGRILEELTPGTRVHVVAEITDPLDEQHIDTSGDVTWTWLHGTGNGIGPSALAATVRAWTPPDGPGYVWFAGEAGLSRIVRRRLRHDLDFPADRYDVIGYWRADKDTWTARYEQVRDRIEAAQAAALASDADFETVRDAVDEAMERAGL